MLNVAHIGSLDEKSCLFGFPVTVSGLIIKLRRHLLKTLPIMIWGQRGIGKSSIVYQIASQYGYLVIEVRLAECDAVDVRGIPYRQGIDKACTDYNTVYAPPSWWPREGCGRVILFIDEFPQASGIVQLVGGRIPHERRIGDTNILPGPGNGEAQPEDVKADHVVVIMAGNPHTDRAGTTKMLSHTADRFSHVQLMPDVDSWRTWADDNNIDGRVIQYIRAHPDALNDFDPKDGRIVSASARSWERVSMLIDGITDIEEIMLHACSEVGISIGSEFASMCGGLDLLPTRDEIETDPEHCRLPGQLEGDITVRQASTTHNGCERVDLCIVVAYMLARFSNNGNASTYWQYISRLGEDIQQIWANDVTYFSTECNNPKRRINFPEWKPAKGEAHPVFKEFMALNCDALNA